MPSGAQSWWLGLLLPALPLLLGWTAWGALVHLFSEAPVACTMVLSVEFMLPLTTAVWELAAVLV